MMSFDREQHFVIAGLGISGISCVRFLQRNGVKRITGWDKNKAEGAQLPNCAPIDLLQDAPPAEYWNSVDVLVVSPGWSLQHPSLLHAKSCGVAVIGDVELFARVNKRPVIGITGSNGKTTVTLLVEAMLNALGKRAVAAGNVGLPILDTLTLDCDVVVAELSSFQLESTDNLSLHSAALLNISDDHLDRHGNMANYLAIKQRIFDGARAVVAQRDLPTVIAGANTPVALEYGLQASTTGVGWDNGWITYQGESFIDSARISLLGAHNILNIQAALALVMSAKLLPNTLGKADIDALASAVYSFKSAPHRCNLVAKIGDVAYIDDSKATNIGATVAALEGLAQTNNGRIILIAGGDAKGADVTQLKPALDKFVDTVLTLGRDGEKIGRLVAGSQHFANLPDAVRCAHSYAKAGDTVLLSPACASLDMFDNYSHRAQVFIDAVSEIAREH